MDLFGSGIIQAESEIEITVIPGGQHLGCIRRRRILERAPEAARSRSLLPQGIIKAAVYQNSALGLAVVNLSDAMAEELGMAEAAGVLAVYVERRGLAYEAGVRGGMVIVRVGRKPVKNVFEFRSALAEQSLEKGITFEVRTKSGSQTITIRGR